MRKRADWMRPVDDPILEVVEYEGNMTPLAVSRDGQVARADVGHKHAGVRMRELTKYGLLKRIDRGLYRITDEGRAYLNGELDASTLEPSEDVDD